MSKNRPQPTTRESVRRAGGADLEEIRETNLAEREAAALEKIDAARLEAVGEQNWRVYLTRIEGPQKKNSNREARLFDCGIDDLEMVPLKLAQDYGDGIYRVRVRLDNRNFEQWDIEIELSPAERLAFNTRAMTLTPQPAAAAPAAAENESVIAAILRQQGEMMAKILERQMTPPAPVDPMANFTMMVTAFSQFQGLMPKAEAQTGLAMFEKGMAFYEKIADARGSGGETNYLDVVMKALESPMVKDALAGLAAQHQPQRQPALTPPLANVVPIRTPARQPAAAPDAITQAIDYLVAQAAAGAGPEQFAEQALTMMPLGLVQELENAPDIMALLEARFPQVIPHRAWFEALVANMFDPEEPAGEGPNDAPPAEQTAKPAA